MYDGAYIAWQDDQNYATNNFDIYLTRLRWDGATKVDVQQASQEPVLRVDKVVPNPVTREAAVRFHLPVSAPCEVSVIDLHGRRIARIMEARDRDAGDYLATWNGRDGDGQRVGAGIYFLVVQAGNQYEVRRLILLR
jgi:hypothetical protein